MFTTYYNLPIASGVLRGQSDGLSVLQSQPAILSAHRSVTGDDYGTIGNLGFSTSGTKFQRAIFSKQ